MVVYSPSASLPTSPVAEVGALLSTMPGTINEGLFLKTAGAGTMIETVSFVTSSGTRAEAIWLSGAPHTYAFEDRAGVPVFDTLRLATNTLLWQQDGVSYRLEANIPRDQAVQLAATVTSS